jgi:hypothetical protein
MGPSVKVRPRGSRLDAHGLLRTAVVALVVAAALVPGLARAEGVSSYRKELEQVEDRLHHDQWQEAQKGCDQVIGDMVWNYARGRGARPLFGLAFAFRALADAGLSDEHAAVWDWSVARLLSPEATSFDLARFGEAGSRLRTDLADHPPPSEEADQDEDGRIVAPRKVHTPRPKFPEGARKARFQGPIQVTFVIDTEGRPERVWQAEESDLNRQTALVVNTFQTFRKWTFRPGTIGGKPVVVFYRGSINYQLQ